MQRHICSLQISRICGAHSLSVDHLKALYTAFTLHYEHGFSAFGLNMLPTDIGLSDAYALLAGELGHWSTHKKWKDKYPNFVTSKLFASLFVRVKMRYLQFK